MTSFFNVPFWQAGNLLPHFYFSQRLWLHDTEIGITCIFQDVIHYYKTEKMEHVAAAGRPPPIPKPSTNPPLVASLTVIAAHFLLGHSSYGSTRVGVDLLHPRHLVITPPYMKHQPLYCCRTNLLYYSYVLWTDWGQVPYIGRVGMNGTGRSKVITEKLVWPNGLTIDYITDRIWWCDAHLDYIEWVLYFCIE